MTARSHTRQRNNQKRRQRARDLARARELARRGAAIRVRRLMLLGQDALRVEGDRPA